MVRWHDDIGIELFPERPDDALIESHPALKDDRRLDIFTGADIAEVITHQRPAETVNDIFHLMSRLLLVHHVRLGENGATPVYGDRRFG